MKRFFVLLVLLGLTGGGCGPKETPAPAAKMAPGTPPSMPALTSAPEAPPPPGAAAAPAVAAAGQAQVPTYEGKDEAEKMTKALHDYYERGGADVPLATSLEVLVKAGYLKSVPVPPPGKKYVVTTQYPFQVRLENK